MMHRLSKPLTCPCCSAAVSTPSLEMVVDLYGLSPQEARILRAVWKGKGFPVPNERIFDFIYEDDPDGGPSSTKMYLALKVSLCHMRKKLAGSGIGIANAGYRQGYRLVVGNDC